MTMEEATLPHLSSLPYIQFLFFFLMVIVTIVIEMTIHH